MDAPFLLTAASAVTWGRGCWGRRSTRSFSAQFFLRFHDWILKLGLLIDVAEQRMKKHETETEADDNSRVIVYSELMLVCL